MAVPSGDNSLDLDVDNANGGLSDDDTESEAVPYLLRSYFVLVGSIVGGKADGKCTLCPNTQKLFTGTLNSTSNLAKHLVRVIYDYNFSFLIF